MKRILILVFLSIISFQEVMALHTKGGWMYYQYLGPGIIDPTKLRYLVGLNQYMICNPSGGQLDNPINFSFFLAKSPYSFVMDVSVPINTNQNTQNCTLQTCHPCISPIPDICYKVVNYETIVELTPNPGGYVVSKQRCCRIAGLSNVPNSSNVGTTYTIQIPGTNTGIPNGEQNTSPVYKFNDTSIVCGNHPFTISFNATDADNDSLVYSFCDAYDGASAGNANPGTASPPPYAFVPYLPPYSGTSPLGLSVTINSSTGLISGTAPPPGEYVICVCVAEYRNGKHLADSRKELHLYVSTCVPLIANPNFNPITCDGFTVSFQDNSTGNPTDYLWNFGDPASGGANTSTLQNPTHTFTDTGIFQIKLVISINGQCSDSVIRPLAVYPGFLPGFINSSILCANTPIQFTDTTYSRYGLVNYWRWNFGDPGNPGDTSHLPNPVYTYPAAGTYNVQLIVQNVKGCIDSVTRPITIGDLPTISLSPGDTTYCGLDSLQLTATGTGTFNWTPNTFITGGNTATPIVYPPVPTRYVVTLTNATGCVNRDSLNVNPLNDLTNSITATPPNICAGDTLLLGGNSNHSPTVTWQWSPPANLGTPNQSVTIAFPPVTTTFTLTTQWGNNCIATATQLVTVKALAIPEAGPDAAVCSGGQSSTQLNASGGDTYSWLPVTGLSNPNIANPIATPTVPTLYIVTVGVNGCAAVSTDSVFISVGSPPVLSVMRDTLICNLDTIPITTTGTGNFLWSPNYRISDTTSASPLVSPLVPTLYHVRLTDSVGCYTNDSVFINVRSTVTLLPLHDTTVCRGDSVIMNTVSDGLHFLWSPNTDIFTDSSRNPIIAPLQSRVYTVTANIGHCASTQSVTLTVVPYPTANAGPDAFICYGAQTQLNVTGGSSYVWSPPTFLNNRFIPNPIVQNPFGSIRYIVTVRDTLGCPKSTKDTIWVNVYPKMIVDAGPPDTVVVDGQPLQLNATSSLSGSSFVWTPNLWLSDPNIHNPVSLPKNDIEYLVEATSPVGCKGTDRIYIRFYRTDPDMFVPTAFTPNGDGLNDILRPILLGMKQLIYFKVFNRFGQMVYSTTEAGKGWDGTLGGKGQDPGTFVWMAEGVTYKGEVRQKKGYAVLIRQ